MKLFSCFIFLVITISVVSAQSLSYSLNVNSFSSFKTSRIPLNKSTINPEIGIAVAVYKPILSKAEAYAELGYANLGITNRLTYSDQKTSRYIETKESAPSLFMKLGLNKKWSKISIGISPMLVYKLKSTVYFSDYDLALVNEKNDRSDNFQYGFDVSSQVLILEGQKHNSIWLKPFFTYQQYVNSDYNETFIGTTSSAGMGIVYKFKKSTLE